MAKVFTRICVKDFTVTDPEGTSASIQRGKEYTVSDEYDTSFMGRAVTVFSRYWAPFPVDCFDPHPQPLGGFPRTQNEEDTFR